MQDYTSFIPGNSPVPEPSGPKLPGIIISVLLCVAFSSLIIFIIYEFGRDISGNPIEFQGAARKELNELEDPEESLEQKLFNSMAYFRLLSPLPKSMVSSGQVTVLCTWRAPDRSAKMPLASMPLWVDDMAMPWNMQFGENTWLAQLELTPGEHRLRTPVFEESFYVADPEALGTTPEDGKALFTHLGVGDEKQCGNCHYWIDRPEDLVRAGYGLTIGPWKGAESCMNCHESKELERKHLHPHSTFEDCALCHVVHGTTEPEKPLLKSPKSRLCVQCHETP